MHNVTQILGTQAQYLGGMLAAEMLTCWQLHHRHAAHQAGNMHLQHAEVCQRLLG